MNIANMLNEHLGRALESARQQVSDAELALSDARSEVTYLEGLKEAHERKADVSITPIDAGKRKAVQ